MTEVRGKQEETMFVYCLTVDVVMPSFSDGIFSVFIIVTDLRKVFLLG